ncbi:calcium/sodium antiporter [Dethiothermospora halolimnae]|uniref:calcium/sodium antiporter n=1 Tax=Dethiothermospora halolimnae TaxID=3114390 RepID=UPI003CCBDCF7
MDYIILIVGFALLIKGADYFVDGASSIAKIFKVPTILIGLTIVAFGTSAPEAAVSINAALQDSSEIAVGNIVGSCIFNLLLVIGISSMIKPIKIQRQTLLKEFPFLLLTSIILFILSFDVELQGHVKNTLTRADGLILLSVFSVFLYYLIEMALTSKDAKDQLEEDVAKMPLPKSVFFSILGFIGIVYGGNIVVDSSTTIALQLGMSETLVGLTVVAFGTSLPELVTSVVAAFKGENDIAIGNVVGSNVFNVLLVLGVTSVIKTLPIDPKVFFDMLYLLGATVLTFIFVTTQRKTTRFEGALMSIAHIGYMAYIIVRN